jgi:ferritin
MKKSPLIPPSELDPLNERGRDEIIASHTYRYASTCFQKQGLFGLQKYYMNESKSELKHRGLLEDFANNMGAELDMPAIPAIEFKKEDPKGILEHLYDIEVNLLRAYEKDHKEADSVATKVFLQDMIRTQTEGVGEAGDNLALLESKGVAWLDENLGAK